VCTLPPKLDLTQKAYRSASSGDEEDKLRAKRGRNNDMARVNEPPRLSCPYFQRKPYRYGPIRACSGPGWPDIHRLKYVTSCIDVIHYKAQH
jgi:hypothetical protein